MLRWNLSSFIHRLNIVKDHNRYPTEISLLISNRSFWVSKLQKTKCSHVLLTLLLFNCLWRGAKTWHKKFKTWLNGILVFINLITYDYLQLKVSEIMAWMATGLDPFFLLSRIKMVGNQPKSSMNRVSFKLGPQEEQSKRYSMKFTEFQIHWNIC